jgi:hypothetical protein
MAIGRLWAKLKRIAGRPGEMDQTDPLASALDLLRSLQLTQPGELNCGQVYELIEAAAEAQLRGEPVERIMPLIALHLKVCPDCLEEYEALLRVLRSTDTS